MILLNSRKSLFFLLLLLSAVIGTACIVVHHALPAFSGSSAYTVVLDAGHGAPDGGAVGANGTEEKDVNLDIVLKLQEVLESRGARVILTRTGDSGIFDDEDATIHEKKVSDMHNRLDIINNSDADLFLSIHMNAFPKASSHGLHVFYARNHPEAQVQAQAITDSIAKLTGAEAHEVKTASEKLYLMKNPTPPAILIECGFITNPTEEKLLNTDDYRAKIAFAIANAVLPQNAE